jgi:DNA-binding GntR family transcriptional regulator
MCFALQNDNLLAWAEADDEFHRLLVASCGNGRIAETIMDQSHRARMLSLKLRPTPTKSVQEHQLIIDAITPESDDRSECLNGMCSLNRHAEGPFLKLRVLYCPCADSFSGV